MTNDELLLIENNITALNNEITKFENQLLNLIQPIVEDVLSRKNPQEMTKLTCILPDGDLLKKVNKYIQNL